MKEVVPPYPSDVKEALLIVGDEAFAFFDYFKK